MSAPLHGSPVGLEIPALDVARGAAFYTAVFKWRFAPSSLGLPAEKLQTFDVPNSPFPVGGAIRRVDEILVGKGATKLYLYVDDIAATQEAIANHGGKKVSEVIPEGSKGFFQFFEDTEGSAFAIYTYAK